MSEKVFRSYEKYRFFYELVETLYMLDLCKDASRGYAQHAAATRINKFIVAVDMQSQIYSKED